MKEEMAPLEKLQKFANEDLTKPQHFMTLSLYEARIGMRLNTRMPDIAGDMPGYKGT